jgi:hypothetical protein
MQTGPDLGTWKNMSSYRRKYIESPMLHFVNEEVFLSKDDWDALVKNKTQELCRSISFKVR